jgi:hypothetical protein
MSESEMPTVVHVDGREVKVLGMDGVDRLEAYLRQTGRAELGQALNAAMLELHCENPSVAAFVLGTALQPDEQDWKKRREAGDVVARKFVDKLDLLNTCHTLLGLVPRITDAEKRVMFYIHGKPLHEILAESPKEGLAAADPTGSPG